MRVALSTRVFDDATIEEIAEYAADAGFEGVEVVSGPPHLALEDGAAAAKRIKRVLDGLALTCVCLSTDTGGYGQRDDAAAANELEALLRHAELASILGAPFVRQVTGAPSSTLATSGDYAREAEWLQHAAELLTPSNLCLIVETLPQTLCDSPTGAARLLKDVASPTIGLLLDPANLHAEGHPLTPSDAMILVPWTRLVHIKDLQNADSRDSDGSNDMREVLFGAGQVDFGSTFLALLRANYNGVLSLEQRDEDPMTASRHNLGAIRSLLARCAQKVVSEGTETSRNRTQEV